VWRKAQAELRSAIGPREWNQMFRIFQTITDVAQRAAVEKKRAKS